MKAHFFDIDTLIEIEGKVWIVDKLYPNTPVMRIDKSEFNLIKKEIYKKNGIKIKLSGEDYFFPEKLANNLKINCKNKKADITNLAFSMQEFLNKEIIEKIDHRIKIENITHLKNSTDDIYIICSKNTKVNYEPIISKFEEKIKENGLKIDRYYFISETFYNRDEDDISYKKVRLLIQHLLGIKTDKDKLTEEELKEYDEISFYEDDLSTIQLAKKSVEILQFILNNSDRIVSDRIKEKLKKTDKSLEVNLITPNKLNRFIKSNVEIKIPNLLKTFESFKWSKKY